MRDGFFLPRLPQLSVARHHLIGLVDGLRQRTLDLNDTWQSNRESLRVRP